MNNPAPLTTLVVQVTAPNPSTPITIAVLAGGTMVRRFGTPGEAWIFGTMSDAALWLPAYVAMLEGAPTNGRVTAGPMVVELTQDEHDGLVATTMSPSVESRIDRAIAHATADAVINGE